MLGAGFAGLGAGYAAQSKGRDVVVFEKDSTYGGLCGNFAVGGFSFDKAVHMCFATDPLCSKLFYAVPHYAHNPESTNYKAGTWVRHPRAKQHLCTPRGGAHQGDKKLRLSLGDIRLRLITPQLPLHVACDRRHWGGGRLYLPSIDEVLMGAFSDHTPNVYYAKTMNYPKRGGYKAFAADIANMLDIRYSHKAIKIDAKEHRVTFDNGEVCEYHSLITSIHLPELIAAMNAPSEITDEANKLKATRVTLVSVGFKRFGYTSPRSPLGSCSSNRWGAVASASHLLPANCYSSSGCYATSKVAAQALKAQSFGSRRLL